jgi:hypothetical protein
VTIEKSFAPFDELPAPLRNSAFQAVQELAWPRRSAVEVIRWLGRRGLSVCGIEVWLPSAIGPEIPSPIIYTWEARPQDKKESWSDFVERSNRTARAYVEEFQWDQEDVAYQSREPFFNLEVCGPEQEGAEEAPPEAEDLPCD